MAMWINGVDLVGQHARGGSATVWRARHRGLAVDVALKVVHASDWRASTGPAEVAWEARLLARLRHRHIVSLFDYGEVSAGLAARWSEQVPAGSRYLALEFAENTLADVPLPATWADAKEILVAVLHGLAHTHARGLIHCDLKPQNILCMRDGIKLSDFGISRWLRADAIASQDVGGMGTPAFMAPEQICDDAVGSYTDIYAVGCLAFWLVQGMPPFAHGGRDSILRGHLADEPPAIQPRFACPAGLGQWLAGLLAKVPLARFSCAADACNALERLGPPVAQTVGGPALVTQAGGTVTTELLDLSLADVQVAAEGFVASHVAPTASTEFIGSAWRDSSSADSDRSDRAPYSSALLGLRAAAMVGRLPEREQLWQLLGAVHEQRTPRIAVIAGESGIGKSRLARWVLEHAVELGVATAMVATHSPVARAGDGLPGALSVALACHGRSRTDAIAHVGRLLAPMPGGASLEQHQIAALVDVARQDATTVASHPASRADGRWLDVVVEFLEVRSRQRPVILWFDDAHWGLESLAFLERILLRDSACPLAVLAVVTVEPRGLVERPEAAALLERIVRSPAVTKLELTGLSTGEQAVLLEDLLPEQPTLRQQLQRLARGNPLFALQGAIASLESTQLDSPSVDLDAQDKRLPTPAPSLPRTLGELWQLRIERCLDQYSSGDTRALAEQVLYTLAAARSGVTREELEAVCGQSPARLVHAVLQGFLKAGFLTERRKQYSFAYGLLRDRLCAMAEQDQRFGQLNVRWADGLSRLYGERSLWVAERIATHLFLARRFDESLAWVPKAAEHSARLGFMHRTRAILRFREDVLGAMGEPPDSVLRAHGWLLRVRHFLPYETGATLDGWLAKAKTATDLHDDEALHAHFHFARCHLYRGREKPSESIADGHRAAPHYRRIGDLPSVASLERVFGEMERKLGHFDTSMKHYETAASICEQLGDTFLRSWCRMGMAMTRKAQGKFEHVDSLLSGALEGFESAGAGASIASCLNEKGELARLLGDLDNALHCYRNAAAAVPATHLDATTIQWNIALVLLQQRSFAAAAVKIAQVRTDLVVRRREGRLIYPELGELVCAAHARRWRNWDRRLAQIASQLAERVALPDFAVCAGLAAQECARAAEPLRAQKAYALAAAQWHSLGRDNEVALLRAKLDAMQRPVQP